MKIRYILVAIAVIAVAGSVLAAPRKRKAKVNDPQPMPAPVPAQAQRDPAALDRLLYEAVTCYYFSPMDDLVWAAERTRICTQQDEKEYDFYVKLEAATKTVIDATTHRAALDALNALEDFVDNAIKAPGSNVKYYFGSRYALSGRSRAHEYGVSDKGRKVTNGILEYMLMKTSSIPAKRMIEGWLASRDHNYVAELAEEVVESGFSPGQMVMGELQAMLDESAAHAPYYRSLMWYSREARTQKILEVCQKMSAEVRKIRAAVGRRNAPPDAAKKAIKQSLSVLDREVRLYRGAQLVEGKYAVNHSDEDKEAMKLEIAEDYERLLTRISESLRDPSHKEIVDKRLEAQRRQIESEKDKRKKMKPNP